MGMRRVASLAVLLASCAPATAPAPAAGAATPASRRTPAAPAESDAQRYRAAMDAAIEAALTFRPVWATAVGDHRFDDRLDDFDVEGEAKGVAELRARATRLRALLPKLPRDADPGVWGTDHPALDAELVADQLEGHALSREQVATPRRDPSAVVGMIGWAVTQMVSHDYAPKAQRYLALAKRLEQVPATLRAARRRLEKPTRPALENLAIVGPGVAGNLRGNIAKTDAAALGGDAALSARLSAAASGAADAIDAYVKDVALAYPTANASDDPIGAELWSKLARLVEGVTDPAAEVRKMGEAEVARLEAELDALMPRVAKKGESRAKMFERLSADAPEPEKLLDEYRERNARVEKWLRSTAFVTVPWERAALTIVQTPPERRGTSLASMNVAGVLEPELASGQFEVNLPDASMPPARRDALRAFHARGMIELVSVHEAIPGHYLQSLHNKSLRSKARKLFRAATTGEGWAHYCEVAVLGAGYVPKDPELVRVFAIRMALQRAVRVIVDVGLNDGSLGMEQAAKLLEEKAFLAPDAARLEARRALVWPANMFTYTYGKLAILALRAKVESKQGKQFDLCAFHDRLLSLGSVPVRHIGPVAFGL